MNNKEGFDVIKFSFIFTFINEKHMKCIKTQKNLRLGIAQTWF